MIFKAFQTCILTVKSPCLAQGHHKFNWRFIGAPELPKDSSKTGTNVAKANELKAIATTGAPLTFSMESRLGASLTFFMKRCLRGAF